MNYQEFKQAVIAAAKEKAIIMKEAIREDRKNVEIIFETVKNKNL